MYATRRLVALLPFLSDAFRWQRVSERAEYHGIRADNNVFSDVGHGQRSGTAMPLKALGTFMFAINSALSQPAVSRGRGQRAFMQDARQAIAVPAESDGKFQEKREALKACLAREYTSFFRPFEEEFYSEEVTFSDPLNNLNGRASYKGNVQMLSGESLIGNILFSDGFIDLHGVEDVPGDPTRLRTRWTLGFVFKLLPWKPKALFSGISEYVIDPSSAIVLSQRDYWDTLSLGEGGSYVPEVGVQGAADLIAQLLPSPLKPAQGQEPEIASDARWSLLRRARVYRIYRGRDGLVFALPAPGSDAGLEAVESELKRHGLTPGQQTKVDGSPAIELLLPHPWVCDSQS